MQQEHFPAPGRSCVPYPNDHAAAHEKESKGERRDLQEDLSKLHQLQKDDVIQRQLKLQQKAMNATSLSSPQQTSQSKLQDEHLNVLASNLSKLSVMATSLNEQFSIHNNLMVSLEDKAGDMHKKTRAATRRADRLMQKMSWAAPSKRDFEK